MKNTTPYAIEIKSVSKRYLYNQKQPYHSLRDTLSGLLNQKVKPNKGFLALNQISLKIKKGEILGIIGRNGAGKSTLLKVLSRITPPTKGSIVINGRVGSLLEVGTGFHPELTGRENIYLNGAILGMKKGEIDRKFNEIVEFSGIKNFIDTPVKRYSSGMYVRLAFSVAAHIEPEILLVDEVLSVGDAEFSEKSLDKLKQVSSDKKRTVIFVSHNLAAIRNLCTRAIWIDKGKILAQGSCDKVISKYIKNVGNTVAQSSGKIDHPNQQGTKDLLVNHIFLQNNKGANIQEVISGEDVVIIFKYKSLKDFTKVRVGLSITSEFGQNLIMDQNSYWRSMFDVKKGEGEFVCKIKRIPLIEGNYFLSYRVEAGGLEVDYPLDPVLKLNIVNGDFFATGVVPIKHSPVLVDSEWSHSQ